MRSISELKKKLALAAVQGKDHRRSAMIRAMRRSLRQQVKPWIEAFPRRALVRVIIAVVLRQNRTALWSVEYYVSHD